MATRTGSPEDTYASWGKALETPAVRGLVVGRALLFPPDGDVAARGRHRRRARPRRCAHEPSGTGVDNAGYVRPAGTAVDGEFEVAVTSTAANPVQDWQHTGLRVATTCARRVRGARQRRLRSIVVVPLAGSFRVEVDAADGDRPRRDPQAVALGLRRTDRRRLRPGRGSRLRVTGIGSDAGRVALCGAPAHKAAAATPFRHLTASEVPVELRGAGIATREVRNFGLPDVLDADSMIACEVITPAGNW